MNTVKADSHIPCRSPAVLKPDSHIPCRSLVHDKRCFVSHWPSASEIGMFLVATFLELRVVAARSRKMAGGQHAVSRRPMLLLDSHNAIPFPRCSHAVTLPRPCHERAVSLSERRIRGMAGERHGNGTVYVNQTRPHCVNQMGKTQSKPLAELHGMGTAWYV
jgi:hypothetical protein